MITILKFLINCNPSVDVALTLLQVLRCCKPYCEFCSIVSF